MGNPSCEYSAENGAKKQPAPGRTGRTLHKDVHLAGILGANRAETAAGQEGGCGRTGDHKKGAGGSHAIDDDEDHKHGDE